MYKGQRLTLKYLLDFAFPFLNPELRNFASITSLIGPGISHLSFLRAGIIGRLQHLYGFWDLTSVLMNI